MPEETTPLLPSFDSSDHHEHFCLLVGIPPSDKHPPIPIKSACAPLYIRANRKRRAQNITYALTATLANTLLLAQVVLGAFLTALGASSSSYKLITIFGVVNTIIAGLVAYLKSRGQPMRARMFRDDLEEVVDEIEDSKTMWLGIKNGVLGYDEVDVDDSVSVRSEVARLTRLYETAVKKYTENNPDLYSSGGGKGSEWKGLKGRPQGAGKGGNPREGPMDKVYGEEGPAVGGSDGKGKGGEQGGDGADGSAGGGDVTQNATDDGGKPAGGPDEPMGKDTSR